MFRSVYFPLKEVYKKICDCGKVFHCENECKGDFYKIEKGCYCFFCISQRKEIHRLYEDGIISKCKQLKRFEKERFIFR
jgi:hypothetical protein